MADFGNTYCCPSCHTFGAPMSDEASSEEFDKGWHVTCRFCGFSVQARTKQKALSTLVVLAEHNDRIARMFEPPAQPLSAGAVAIERERARQIKEEGWTAEHDDKHPIGAMSCAAACYALATFHDAHYRDDGTPVGWPWCRDWWKPRTPRENLVRAGALIAAEIDRLDRAAEKQASDPCAS